MAGTKFNNQKIKNMSSQKTTEPTAECKHEDLTATYYNFVSQQIIIEDGVSNIILDKSEIVVLRDFLNSIQL